MAKPRWTETLKEERDGLLNEVSNLKKERLIERGRYMLRWNF
jgi:hypothetical protein